jgi:lipoprotein-releasing system permease protein
MTLEARIARRYLWAARRQKHTAFLSLISMLGLAVGVMVLLLSLALLSGLQGQIKSRLIAASPQILIEPRGSNTIADAAPILARAKNLGMKEIDPIVSGIAWGANESEKRGRPVRIRSRVAGGRGDTIALTRDFAAAIGLDAHEAITIVAPRTRLTPFGPVPVIRRYRITAIASSSTDQRDAADAFMPLAEAQDLFGTNGRLTSIEMFGNADRSDDVQRDLAAAFPNVQVKTWKEINHPLFLALRLEKIVMFITISMIIFVAALNLISSLSMLITEKRPQVGVLRTLGATEKNILLLFIEVGLFIGLAGTVLGNIAGIGISWTVNRYHLIPLPRDIYFLSYLPLHLDVSDVVEVNVIAVLLSILATWYPARIASRLDPIAAIREE